jgi:hypothetical protein
MTAGLYGLVPIIADIRGFFSRYNWIADLLLIIATPVENFVNANFIPLPQVRTLNIGQGTKPCSVVCDVRAS